MGGATLADNTENLNPPLQSYQQQEQQYQNERTNSVSGSLVPTAAINPFDHTNISIMPPPNSGYLLNNADYLYAANTNTPSTFDSSNNNNEEDWLTLNLNPLLSSSTDNNNNNNNTNNNNNHTGASFFPAGIGGTDAQWFGNFGPEISGNLEVLGKLVEGWDNTTSGLTGFS